MSSSTPALVSLADVSALSADSSSEDLMDLRNRIKAQQAQLKQAAELLEQLTIDHIQAHGDITVGEIHYYVGKASTTKLQEGKLEAALCAVTDAVQGDMAKLTGCFSSGAFKPGACKGVLAPEVFESLFATTVEMDLKTGKPLKTLVAVNPRFIRSQSPTPAGHVDPA